METVKLLMTLLPVALTAGINLYATVATIGICVRLELIEGVPEELKILGHTAVIAVALVLYVIEFVVDKFEFFDNAWDVLSTFIRPLGAALIGMTVLGDVHPVTAVLGALVCGGVAMESHLAKAGSRAVLNVASPAETASNAVVSTLEDGFVVLWVALTLKYPLVMGCITLILIIVLAVMLPVLFRWACFFIKAVFARLRSIFGSGGGRVVELPPTELLQEAGSGYAPRLSAPCICRGIKGLSGRAGFLIITDVKLLFLTRQRRKLRKWEQPLTAVPAAMLRKRLLVDILEIPCKDEIGADMIAKFVFLKTGSGQAAQIHEFLRQKN